MLSCSYRIMRTYEMPPKPLNSQNYSQIKFSKKKDLFGLDAKYLGTIKLDDSGSTVNCSYQDAMELLRKEAGFIEADIVNIINYKAPDGYSTCFRCIAEFYSSDFDSLDSAVFMQQERIKVTLTEDMDISWSDFYVKLPDTSTTPFYFESTLHLVSGGRTFWNGSFQDFSSEPVLYLDISKIRPDFLKENNIEHLQTLININRLFSKKLYIGISNRTKTTNIAEVQLIVSTYNLEMKMLESDYFEETEYGSNKSKQEEWNVKIDMLLANIENEIRDLNSEYFIPSQKSPFGCFLDCNLQLHFQGQ